MSAHSSATQGGIDWNFENGKWEAWLCLKYQPHFLGFYTTYEEAAIAYNTALFSQFQRDCTSFHRASQTVGTLPFSDLLTPECLSQRCQGRSFPRHDTMEQNMCKCGSNTRA